MNTNTLALHVAKRYLDHTLSLIKSTRDAIADVSGFEPHVGDLTVSEHNITAAVSNLDTFRISLKDPEKYVPLSTIHANSEQQIDQPLQEQVQGSTTGGQRNETLAELTKLRAELETQKDAHNTLVLNQQTDHSQILAARDLTISTQVSELHALQQKLREKESMISSRDLKLSTADTRRSDALDQQEKQLTKKLVALANQKENELAKLMQKLQTVEEERDAAVMRVRISHEQKSDERSESELANMKRRSETITSERDAAVRAKLALEKQKAQLNQESSYEISKLKRKVDLLITERDTVVHEKYALENQKLRIEQENSAEIAKLRGTIYSVTHDRDTALTIKSTLEQQKVQLLQDHDADIERWRVATDDAIHEQDIARREKLDLEARLARAEASASAATAALEDLQRKLAAAIHSEEQLRIENDRLSDLNKVKRQRDDGEIASPLQEPSDWQPSALQRFVSRPTPSKNARPPISHLERSLGPGQQLKIPGEIDDIIDLAQGTWRFKDTALIWCKGGFGHCVVPVPTFLRRPPVNTPRLGQRKELFFRNSELWYYMGTYECVMSVYVDDSTLSAIDSEFTDIIYRETGNRVNEMHDEGLLTFECFVLECVGFYNTLDTALSRTMRRGDDSPRYSGNSEPNAKRRRLSPS